MTLRLTDAETEALRVQAEIEGRSMQDVARGAVRHYIEQYAHRGRVAASSAEGARRYAVFHNHTWNTEVIAELGRRR